MIERTMQSDRIRYIGQGRGRRRPSGRTHRDTTVDVPVRPSRGSRSHPSRKASPTAGQFALYDVRALGVRRALDRIPDHVDRQIAVMRFFVGLSIEEISQRLGRPVENVRARYRFTVVRLERDLRQYL